MNIYQFKTNCQICGGEGMSTADGIYNSVHRDPNVCRSILKQREEAISKRENASAKSNGSE